MLRGGLHLQLLQRDVNVAYNHTRYRQRRFHIQRLHLHSVESLPPSQDYLLVSRGKRSVLDDCIWGGGTFAFGAGTYLRTRDEDSGSFMRGSLWERWTRWNVVAFFLSMNFRGMVVVVTDCKRKVKSFKLPVKPAFDRLPGWRDSSFGNSLPLFLSPPNSSRTP